MLSSDVKQANLSQVLKLGQNLQLQQNTKVQKTRLQNRNTTHQRNTKVLVADVMQAGQYEVEGMNKQAQDFTVGFHRQNGELYCDKIKIEDIRQKVPDSPFYLYSQPQITYNYNAYQSALTGLDSIIGYAVKTNSNLHILKHIAKLGAGAVLVSGNELKLAEKAGFDPTRTVLNGNGKLLWEIDLAIEKGVLINVDSEFDFENIETSAKKLNKTASVLLRINPDVDPQVHKHVSTGLADSKFGIRNDHLQWFLDRSKKSSNINLVGIHCHLGSTIKKVDIFKDASEIMVRFAVKIKEQGFNLKYLNIGGGLGIDYEHKNQKYPTPTDLVNSIRSQIENHQLTLIMEPGRSMVGNCGVLVNNVLGVKENGKKNFIVIDGNMAFLIRPALYDAYHHIEYTTDLSNKEEAVYDVVGPICESGDFLAKDRKLHTPDANDGLVIFDAGSYCMAMASQYNLKMRPAEFWTTQDGENMQMIRKQDSFNDYLKQYDTL